MSEARPHPAGPPSWHAALLPGLLAALGALVVVVVGLASYGGHVSRFVHAGTYWVQPRDHLVLQKGDGYDGQFVYRLALAPFDLRTTAHGITLDTSLRDQRIGLPLLAWLLSGGGHATVLPYVLLLTEVAAIGALGFLGGLVALHAGRPAVCGLLLASPAALVFSVLHDLTEPLEIALLTGGLLLWWSRRPVAAGVLLAAATLTRETALLAAAAIAVPRLTQIMRARRISGDDAAWLTPLGFFVGWVVFVAIDTHSLPLGESTGANLAPPFAGIDGLVRALPDAAWHQWPLFLVQLALLSYLVVLVLPVVRTVPAPLPLAWALFVVLVLCGSTVVWTGWDDARFAVELWAVSLLVLLTSRRRLHWVGLLSAVVWVLSLAANRF